MREELSSGFPTRSDKHKMLLCLKLEISDIENIGTILE